MKVLYIVNMDENNKKGLFMATHEKIKAIMKLHPENEYKIISCLLYTSPSPRDS